ncbi:MAG: glycerol-3-phosphate 1-O-acyltransferase PlsY [Bacteroidales bacterium]
MEWISIIIGYLLGSIPSAVWIGKRFHKKDVRDFGSKNAGATNTYRVFGWQTGTIVLMVDIFKGYGALWLCSEIFGLEQQDTIIILTGIAAVIGHIFPLMAQFRGGKGVATLAGIGAFLFPDVLIIILGIFLLVFLTTHYVSLSSITAAISLPFISFFFGNYDQSQIVIFTILLALLVPITHHKNIRRLLSGSEKKINFRKKKP